jgi:hypothetical protein
MVLGVVFEVDDGAAAAVGFSAVAAAAAVAVDGRAMRL